MTIANVHLTTSTHARVTVTLDIPVGDNWGGTTEVNQIVGQATDSALGKLHTLLRDGASVVGRPVVTMIIVVGKE